MHVKPAIAPSRPSTAAGSLNHYTICAVFQSIETYHCFTALLPCVCSSRNVASLHGPDDMEDPTCSIT